MTLSIFPTFLAFLARKPRWIRANQKTLPEIRHEAFGRRLGAEQTLSLLDGLVRAGWLRLVTTKTGGRAVHWVAFQPANFFRGTNARKVRKVRKGVPAMRVEHLSDLSDLSGTGLCLLLSGGDPASGLSPRHSGKADMTRTAIRNLFGRHRSTQRLVKRSRSWRPKGRSRMESKTTGGRPSELWLAKGCEELALTATTATIRRPSGSTTAYRRNNTPAPTSPGGSLDDLQ
jgi:hypothetical protein